MQPHCDYVCSAFYFNFTKKIEKQNLDYSKQMHTFLPKLDNMVHISYKEFETLKWLLGTEKIQSMINSIVFMYFNVLII